MAEHVKAHCSFDIGTCEFVARKGEWLVWDGSLDENGNEIPSLLANEVFRNAYEECQ